MADNVARRVRQEDRQDFIGDRIDDRQDFIEDTFDRRRYRVGMSINVLPRGYSTFYVGGSPYSYYGGVYYQPGSTGYVVISAPIGAIVYSLPTGYTTEPIGGITFYHVANVTYQGVYYNGRVGYKVVRVG